MACPLCGDRCTCSATDKEFVGEHTAVLIDPDSSYSSEMSEQQFAASLHSSMPPPRSSNRVAVGQTATATADPAFYRPASIDGTDDQGAAWRDEISQRVQAHRARRRRRFDPDASLTFGFEPESNGAEEARVEDAEAHPTPAAKAPRMYRRIALEMEATAARDANAAAVANEAAIASEAAAAMASETNIIEFPRSAQTEGLFAAYELAEPMVESPRILDVPEETIAPLAPSNAAASLSSLRLDEALEQSSEAKETPDWIRNYRDEYDEDELELPLQVAALRSRFISAAIDTALIFTATAVFCVIVLSITKFMPQGKPGILAAIGLTATLWLAYHYAFLVFSGMTPGMQVAQLELCSFEGCYPLRRTRGARALAMGVSCMSLGMGFAWAAVDEDRLGWHDRITRTYLRPS